MKSIKVVKDSENEVPAEVFEKAIVDAAVAMRKLNETRLTRAAIVALIHDKSKVLKGTIELVLNNLEQLEAIWLKPKKPRHK